MLSRLRFSAPVGPVMAAVAVLALVVVGLFIIGPGAASPAATQSAGPSASASATLAEPTPTAQPTATHAPTPTPTPGVAAWTGLEWVAGTTAPGSWWEINDIVSRGQGYVGVGTARHGDHAAGTVTISPAFFTSIDGLRWTLAQEGDPVVEEIAGQDEEWFPARVVRVGETLLAIGHNPWGPSAPKLWRSEEGLTWTPLDSPTWREALASNELISVAAGPTGVVVVAAEGTTAGMNPRGLPLILHSTDGVTWDRLVLSSVFDKAYFQDVTAYAGGFAIVGRVGEAEVRGGPPPVGKPAAWTSVDGVTWVAAEVEGSEAPDASLYIVAAGANGLFTTGYRTEFTSWQAPRSAWASADGRSWQLRGEMGTDLPQAIDLPNAAEYPTNVTGDGAHMVMFGRESCKTTELVAWTSLDGVTWRQLAFSGASIYLVLIPGPICNDDGTEGAVVGTPTVSNAFVTADGVFVVTTSSAPTPPTYWFLRAITP
jgi:hypothetical protein